MSASRCRSTMLPRRTARCSTSSIGAERDGVGARGARGGAIARPTGGHARGAGRARVRAVVRHRARPRRDVARDALSRAAGERVADAARSALLDLAACRACVRRLRARSLDGHEPTWSAALLGSAAAAAVRRAATDAATRRHDARRHAALVRAAAAVRARRASASAGLPGGTGPAHRARAQVPRLARVGDAMARADGARCACRPTSSEERAALVPFRSSRRATARARLQSERANWLARWRGGGSFRCATDVLVRARATRDADAVDTRGATPQRFGRVPRAASDRDVASRRARRARGRRGDDRRDTQRVRRRALRRRRTHSSVT